MIFKNLNSNLLCHPREHNDMLHVVADHREHYTTSDQLPFLTTICINKKGCQILSAVKQCSLSDYIHCKSASSSILITFRYQLQNV